MSPVPSLSSPDSPAAVTRTLVASSQRPRPVQDMWSKGTDGAQLPPSSPGSREESSLGRSEGHQARETGRGRSDDLWKTMLLKREGRALAERYDATHGSLGVFQHELGIRHPHTIPLQRLLCLPRCHTSLHAPSSLGNLSISPSPLLTSVALLPLLLCSSEGLPPSVPAFASPKSDRSRSPSSSTPTSQQRRVSSSSSLSSIGPSTSSSGDSSSHKGPTQSSPQALGAEDASLECVQVTLGPLVVLCCWQAVLLRAVACPCGQRCPLLPPPLH